MDKDKNKTQKKEHRINFNRTRIASYLSIVGIAVLIIVFSLIPIGLSLDKLFSPTWWTNLVILIFLAVYGLPYGDSEGTNYFKTKENGLYRDSRNKFYDVVDRLNGQKIITYFPDWLQFHYVKKRELTYRQMLFSMNLQDERILLLSEEQLQKLLTEIVEYHSEKTGETILFDKITQEQYDMLIAMKHGEIEVVTIDDYNYYLTESDNTTRDIDKQALDASKQKRRNKIIQYGTRIITMVLVSVIWAGIFIDTAALGGAGGGEGAGPTIAQLAQPWLNLLSRLGCLATAIACGIQTARINNKIDIFVFDYKKSILQLFEQEIQEKIFIPVDKKVQLEEKYKLQEEEKKKAIESVVIPESDNNTLLLEKKE